MRITERFSYESGRDYACRMIKENIVSLELAPGCLVSEKELARQLDLSRTPVREALIDLAKVGIIEVLPQRGSRISYIDYQMVDEARFMRNALEVAVCRKLCLTADLALVAPLTSLIRRQEQALAGPNPHDFFHLDDEFHLQLFQIAGMTHTNDLMSSFLVHFDRVRNLALYVSTPDLLLADHRLLVFAILAHDQALAAQTVEAHLSRYKIDEAAIRRSYPHYFRPPEIR